eukprot:CAMPEP_0174904758 /NCGR_PEP_ID=MMETSP0167-20121228/50034_1 /TAXON_ID=38298 /ORGANISM="Rhodella maculata, Strain CCMP736" /LENGTH=69 /DNA_ID=CAMNT_0016147493 /DNA_START=375 /DNA_END=584 /DNA_ORIENTATION=+
MSESNYSTTSEACHPEDAREPGRLNGRARLFYTLRQRRVGEDIQLQHGGTYGGVQTFLTAGSLELHRRS